MVEYNLSTAAAYVEDLKSFTVTWFDDVTNSTGNVTTEDAEWQMPSHIKSMKITQRVCIVSVTISVMISMGCSITMKEIVSNLRRPIGIFIGFLCQYGVLPLLGFGLSHAFKLEAPHAIGVLVIACCPGGTTSNMLAYWINGDLSLSICMTTCSTLVAFGMMPLLLFIYSRSWTEESAVIPYMQIIVTLITILVPVALGFFIRYKSNRIAGILGRVLPIIALIGVAMITVLEYFIHSETFTEQPSLWIIGFILPVVASTLSYAIAVAAKLNKSQCRTVAVETSLQNVGVALTLLMLSFDDDRGRVTAFPTIYVVIEGTCIYMLVPVGILTAKTRWCKKKGDTENEAGLQENGVIHGSDENEEKTEKINVSDGKEYKEIPKAPVTSTAGEPDETKAPVTRTAGEPDDTSNGWKSANGDAPLRETVI